MRHCACWPPSCRQMSMLKILVSACLLEQRVRYDGQLCPSRPQLQQWQQQGRVIALCPEVMGGLPVPRAPAERQDDGRILNNRGEDVSAAFSQGAEQAVQLARQHQIRIAILKARSPSCGQNWIYDGSFSSRLIRGDGVTCAQLKALGVLIFDESQLPLAAMALYLLEPSQRS